MISLPPVNASCLFVRLSAPLLALLLALSAAAVQEENRDDSPSPPTYPTRATVEGSDLAVAVAFTLEGPLVAVAPIVERLGGELRPDVSGEGYFLTLDDTEIVFGPGSGALTRNAEILYLSQPPIASEGAGVLVPLDFFEHTYGDLLGFEVTWEADGERLLIRRAERRELSVDVDVVHLQGVTTVVFRFPELPRHRVLEEPGEVRVELIGASLASAVRGRRTLHDPLVRAVDLGAESLRLSLAAGATATSYTLEHPFRLVFDVHRRAGTATGSAGRLAPPAPRPGIQTIVIDPGHGGDETGAVGPSGVAEKDLALLIARALKARLQSRMPVRVVLTRNEDVDLPLETRTSIANQHKADLFLSIHLNAAAGALARGSETYFMSLQASDERAAQAAEEENRSNGTAVPEPGDAGGDDDPLYSLQLILWDLAQSHYLAESQRLARLIQEELNSALGLRDRGVKQAPFRVLMGAAMPAVLVELGFLSNPQEEQRLQDPAYRSQLVDALVRAVSRYRVLVSTREAPGSPAGREGPESEQRTEEGIR